MVRLLNIAYAVAPVAVAASPQGIFGRQAPGTTPAPTATGSTPAPGTTAPPGAGSAPPAGAPSLTQVSISPASVNPTAVPVQSILPDGVMPPQTTNPLPTTATAGSKPTDLSNAPSLPDISSWNPAIYPPLDKAPPTNSPEVQQWIKDVQASGVTIPQIAQFAPGGTEGMCNVAQNKARIGNDTECWWTCGHCTRATDISTCNDKLTWGSSFDDGPAPYTPDLLNFLGANNLKTTFFVVGSRVASRPQFLQTEYILGHQIAVHTWSHTALTTQTNEQIIAELGWSKKVIKDAIGVTPTFMRPPYGDIDDRVRAISLAMGLTPVIWTVSPAPALISFDTFDWEVPGAVVSASQAVAQFETLLKTASQLDTGFIVLEHDLYQQTVDLAVGYFLPSALAQTPKLKIQSIRECLGHPLSAAYAETSGSDKPPSGNGNGGQVTGGGASQAPPPKGGSGGDNSAHVSFAWKTAAAWSATVLAGAIAAAGML
ncbi:glycoside hydrolase/deacetylase [Auricularia subglabra TFB-10046 SS5]|nr:glycoside hydrolase/deacetylase [Auricularia subglabra TFB-10046 SS5]